jgi:hypothetical protein
MSAITQQLTSYPNLPYPLQVGNLQWTDKLEDYPSGTITYKGCTLDLANDITTKYPNLTPITIEGIGFVVMPSGVSVKRSRYGRGDIETYEVVINLDSKWKAKCQRKFSVSPFVQPDNFSRFRYATGVNVAAITSFLGINYVGPAIFFSPDNLETTFEEILKTNCRRLGCFVRFSDVDAVKMIAINNIGSWAFPDNLVIDDGSRKRNPVLPIIDNVAITGKFSKDPFDQEDKLLLPINPQTEIVIQNGGGDTGDDASTLSYLEASGRLASLDMNFDVSGPKKVYTRTEIVDGVVQSELTRIYGYKFRAVDVAEIQTSEGKRTVLRLNGSPSLWWTQVEEQEVTYEYSSILSYFNVYATSTGRVVPIYINPDSANILRGNGYQTILDNAKYLVGTTTRGWKYVRLQKETEGKYESIHSTPPAVSANLYNTFRYAAELCDWKKIPVNGKSGFQIAPLRSLYPASTPTPFQVEVQKYTDIPQDIASRGNIPPRYITQNGIAVIDPEYVIGIVTANPTDSEPFWIKSESSFKSCFAYAKSPAFNPYLPTVTRKAGDNRPEFIFAGEESYTSVIRKVFDYDSSKPRTFSTGASPLARDKAEKFEELTTNDTAQGRSFLDAAQDAVKEVKRGKPPTAQVMLKRWGTAKEKARIEARADYSAYTYNKYYASSDLIGAYPADIVLKYTDNSELNLPYANTVAEAKTTLETDLRMVAMQNVIASKKLAWYYPSLKSGDRVTFSSGQLRISGVSQSLEYRGLQNGSLVVVSEGTQVECGYDQARTVNISQSTYSRNSDGAIAPNVRISSFDTSLRGNFVYNESQRRSFRS